MVWVSPETFDSVTMEYWGILQWVEYTRGLLIEADSDGPAFQASSINLNGLRLGPSSERQVKYQISLFFSISKTTKLG